MLHRTFMRDSQRRVQILEFLQASQMHAHAKLISWAKARQGELVAGMESDALAAKAWTDPKLMHHIDAEAP